MRGMPMGGLGPQAVTQAVGIPTQRLEPRLEGLETLAIT